MTRVRKTTSSEDSEDGSSDDDDDDIDSFDGTNFDDSDSSDDGDSSDDDSGGGALAWKVQATWALREMDGVVSKDNGRGDDYFTAGTGLSTQSVHEGAHAADAAVLGAQLAAPTMQVDQAMEDFSGSDATAFTPTTTTTTRPDNKQAPAAPAPAPQDSTTPTLATPASATPNLASPGQAAQLHAGANSVAPHDIIVNTATASDLDATAAANQSIAAAEMNLVERLKKISANDTKQNSSKNHGITKSAGADNADEDGTTHEVAKSSDNTANDDTAGSTGNGNVSDEGDDEGDDEGAGEGADEDADEGADEDGYDTDDNVEILTGDK
jgi:hypothetical protein